MSTFELFMLKIRTCRQVQIANAIHRFALERHFKRVNPAANLRENRVFHLQYLQHKAKRHNSLISHNASHTIV